MSDNNNEFDPGTNAHYWAGRVGEARAALDKLQLAPGVDADAVAALCGFLDDVRQPMIELDDDERLRNRMSGLLHGVADALNGGKMKNGWHSWHNLPELAEAAMARASAARKATGPLATWWAMVEAQEELADSSIADNATVLHFMGSGASTSVTAGQLRAMFDAIYAPTKPKPDQRKEAVA